MDSTPSDIGRDLQGTADESLYEEGAVPAVAPDTQERNHDSGEAQEEAFPWYLALGAHFAKSPTPEMLNDGGENVYRWVALVGESKAIDKRGPGRLFNYDEHFVVEWMASKLGPVIASMSRAEFLKLYTKAKHSYESKQKAPVAVSPYAKD